MPNSQGGEPFLFEGVQVIAPLDLRLGMSKKPFTDMTWDSKRGKARPACEANVVNSPGLEAWPSLASSPRIALSKVTLALLKAAIVPVVENRNSPPTWRGRLPGRKKWSFQRVTVPDKASPFRDDG